MGNPNLRCALEQPTTAFPRIRTFRWLLAILAASTCWAQTTLSLSSASGVAGGTVALGLTFSDSGNNQVAGVQWSFQYPASITGVTVTAAPALTAASKSITCVASPGAYTCVATGSNDNVIPNGLVGTAQFTLS